jgi:hypothetical protein
MEGPSEYSNWIIKDQILIGRAPGGYSYEEKNYFKNEFKTLV